ncbi:MAG: type II CAAX endopeptidase family protein [Anaerolineales bacterium]
MLTTPWFSLGLVVLITAIVVLAGIKKQPGIGIILAVIILGVAVGFDKLKLSDIGFSAPKSWLATILWSLGLGVVIAFVSTLVIEPAAEKMAGQPHDLSILEKMRGNWKQLLLMLAVAWILASFLEESIFRGFLMSALGSLIGKSGVFASIGLLISAVVFGLAHWYQGKSAAISTAIIGLLLGDIFIWSGYNLWMPILTHGVIDTLGLILIYFNQDTGLKKLLLKEKHEY